MQYPFCMQTARDLMQRNALTIPASMPFAEIVHLFVMTGIHGAPVVDGNGAVVGTISALDLLRETDQALDDERDEGEGSDPVNQLQTATAAELATPEAIWVSPDTPVGQVARTMREERIQRVLVGTDGRLEGILTPNDLLAAVPG